LRDGHLPSFLCQEFNSDPLFVMFHDSSLESAEIPIWNYPLGTATRVFAQSRDVTDNALIDALPFCALPSRFDSVLTEFGITILLPFIATFSDSLIYILQ
jgi:hypothetical protein